MAEVAIPDVLTYMQISQELATKAIARSAILGGGAVDKNLAQTLYIERKSIAWLYNVDPTNSTLRKTANYGLSLCSQYLFEAMEISGNGGVVINPNTPTGATRAVAWRDQFIVGESNSPILAGGSRIVYGVTNMQEDSIQVFRDGDIKLRGTTLDEFRYTLTVTPLYFILDFNEDVQDGYKFVVHGLRNTTSGSSSSGSSTSASLVYQTHTTGATVTIDDATDVLVVNPSAPLPLLAITMPANPVKDKVIRILGGGTLGQGNSIVTALSVVANTGQTLLQTVTPTQMRSGDGLTYLVYTLTQYRRL